jgi:DNA-binding MarR family transcriptional regulator
MSDTLSPPHARIDAARLATWRAFLHAHRHVTEVLAEELRAETGLPLGWYDVLVQLSEAPGRQLRMQDLAEAVVLSKSGLTRLVDRMEVEGYVERAPCDDDRRGTFARLTDAGLDVLEAAVPYHADGVDRHFTGLIADDEVETVRAVLRRIADHLEASDSRAPGPA